MSAENTRQIGFFKTWYLENKNATWIIAFVVLFFLLGVFVVGMGTGYYLRVLHQRARAQEIVVPAYQGTAVPHMAGMEIILDGQSSGIFVDDKNYIALQPLLDMLGGEAVWNQETRMIQIVFNNNEIYVRPNIREATINGRTVMLSSPLRIGDDRSIVSMDFVTRYMQLGLGVMDDRVILTTEPATYVPVLIYHHILPREKNTAMPNNPWVVSTEYFTEQMQFLRDNNFYPVTLDDMENFLLNGRNLPARSIMIHFDDGYYSNFVYAAPILREYNMRAQVFLITSEMEALGDIQPPLDYTCLTFAAMHTIEANFDVFETASHSHDLHDRVYGSSYTGLMHAMRDTIIADTLRSFDFTQNHRAYVYPLSQFNEYVVNALQDAGIVIAFESGNVPATRNANPFAIPRISVYNTTTLEDFIRRLHVFN